MDKNVDNYKKKKVMKRLLKNPWDTTSIQGIIVEETNTFQIYIK